jgi:hypothetical protein
MFLGAGASKPFGAPVTREILPQIMERLEKPGQSDDHNGLRELLAELMPGINNINQAHVLITEVLSLIDYMLLSECVPAQMATREQLTRCRMLLEKEILDLLPGICARECDLKNAAAAKRLGCWMYEVGNCGRFSLISTNYDEIVERGLYHCFMAGAEDEKRPFDAVNKAVNFGLCWRDGERNEIFYPLASSRHSVLKLHGSVDWMKCDLCGWIVCNDNYSLHHQSYHDAPNARCNCGHSPLRPVMIAPSLVRDIRDINILTIWKTAGEELRTADRWYIIGYSMPTEDYAIRSLLMRALKSRNGTPPKIDVYQHGEDEELKDRYRAFLGDCVFHTTGMEGFIEDVVDKGLYTMNSRTNGKAQPASVTHPAREEALERVLTAQIPMT